MQFYLKTDLKCSLRWEPSRKSEQSHPSLTPISGKDALVHSIKVTNPKAVIVGEELLDAYDEVSSDLELESDVPVYFLKDAGKVDAPSGFQDLEALSESASTENPSSTADVRLQDACFYIFTSVTGLPKAIMTHFRWVKASAGFGYCALRLKAR